MTWEALVALTVIGAVLYALARDLAATDVVLLGAATVLMSLSMVSDRFPTPREFVAPFGNEGLVTIAALYVVAAGLTETGAVAIVAERLFGRPATVVEAQARVMVPVAGVSAFLNNTPVVAMFLPVLSEWSAKSGISPSKLFIPLSYAAVLGGTCTLIGTSTNLVVHGLMIEAQKTDPSMPLMGMWTLSPIGVPAAVVGILFVLLASPWLLPDRRSATNPLSDPREYTAELLVQPGSAIDGLTIEAAGLRHLPGAYLAGVVRGGRSMMPVAPDEVLLGNDQLIFVGGVDSVIDLHRTRGLLPAEAHAFDLHARPANHCLVEAVVSENCPLIGTGIREASFRTRYDAVVVAVQRNGERIAGKIGDIVLKPGDTLLLETHTRFLRHWRNSRDFFLVSGVPDSAPRRHHQSGTATIILGVMVTVVALEQYTGVSVLNAALLAAAAMGVTRCLSADQARRSIDWPTLISIGAALGIGRAMETTGVARLSADGILGVMAPLGPIGVLAAVYLLTLVFTEILTNNAAAALAFPIAHAAAVALGASFLPFAVAIAMAASAGFATPLGYQTHLMVYGAGGYRFSDYVRIGVPLDLLIMAVTVTLTPFFFPFF